MTQRREKPSHRAFLQENLGMGSSGWIWVVIVALAVVGTAAAWWALRRHNRELSELEAELEDVTRGDRSKRR